MQQRRRHGLLSSLRRCRFGRPRTSPSVGVYPAILRTPQHIHLRGYPSSLMCTGPAWITALRHYSRVDTHCNKQATNVASRRSDPASPMCRRLRSPSKALVASATTPRCVTRPRPLLLLSRSPTPQATDAAEWTSPAVGTRRHASGTRRQRGNSERHLPFPPWLGLLLYTPCTNFRPFFVLATHLSPSDQVTPDSFKLQSIGPELI
jgi:hypothetical protein